MYFWLLPTMQGNIFHNCFGVFCPCPSMQLRAYPWLCKLCTKIRRKQWHLLAVLQQDELDDLDDESLLRLVQAFSCLETTRASTSTATSSRQNFWNTWNRGTGYGRLEEMQVSIFFLMKVAYCLGMSNEFQTINPSFRWTCFEVFAGKKSRKYIPPQKGVPRRLNIFLSLQNPRISCQSEAFLRDFVTSQQTSNWPYLWGNAFATQARWSQEKKTAESPVTCLTRLVKF